jgi:hypothetical protein
MVFGQSPFIPNNNRTYHQKVRGQEISNENIISDSSEFVNFEVEDYDLKSSLRPDEFVDSAKN